MKIDMCSKIAEVNLQKFFKYTKRFDSLEDENAVAYTRQLVKNLKNMEEYSSVHCGFTKCSHCPKQLLITELRKIEMVITSEKAEVKQK